MARSRQKVLLALSRSLKRKFRCMRSWCASPSITPTAHVSFDVRWDGLGDRQSISDPAFGFSGSYVTGNATIGFSATDDTTDITYTSNPGRQTSVGDPGVGHERNEVFV